MPVCQIHKQRFATYGGCSECFKEKLPAAPRPALVITLDAGLDTHSIEFILLLEKRLDAALLPVGFGRTVSGKGGDRVVFEYRQIAVML